MIIAPRFFIYGPLMAAASHGSHPAADTDSPAPFEPEADVQAAIDRLTSADSDAAWQETVRARDKALRELLQATRDLPVNARELVVIRATLVRDKDGPGPGSCRDSAG